MVSSRADAQSETGSVVAYSPAGIVRRRFEAWPGLKVEAVEVTRRAPFEYSFRAPCHLLIAAELGEREDGETLIEGLPRSNLRVFTHKLTFVPAGHDFRGSQKPRALARAINVYIDPQGPLTDGGLRFSEIEFKPRLFFHDQNLWEAVLKLKVQVENRDTGSMGKPWEFCWRTISFASMAMPIHSAHRRNEVVWPAGSKGDWPNTSRSMSLTTSRSLPWHNWPS
jgi:hypothetical protein